MVPPCKWGTFFGLFFKPIQAREPLSATLLVVALLHGQLPKLLVVLHIAWDVGNRVDLRVHHFWFHDEGVLSLFVTLNLNLAHSYGPMMVQEDHSAVIDLIILYLCDCWLRLINFLPASPLDLISVASQRI